MKMYDFMPDVSSYRIFDNVNIPYIPLFSEIINFIKIRREINEWSNDLLKWQRFSQLEILTGAGSIFSYFNSSFTYLAGVPLNNSGVCGGLVALFNSHTQEMNNQPTESFINILKDKIKDPDNNKQFFIDLFIYQFAQNNNLFCLNPELNRSEKIDFTIQDLHNYSIDELLNKANIGHLLNPGNTVKISLKYNKVFDTHAISLSMISNTDNQFKYRIYDPNKGLSNILTGPQLSALLIKLCKFSDVTSFRLTDINTQIEEVKRDGINPALLANMHSSLIDPIEAEFALENKLLKVDGYSKEGFTPLILTTIEQNYSMVNKLLTKYGANPNQPFSPEPKYKKNNKVIDKFAENGWMPLQFAAMMHDQKMMFLLLKNGAGIHHPLNNGKTLLEYVRAENAASVAEELLYIDSLKDIPESIARTKVMQHALYNGCRMLTPYLALLAITAIEAILLDNAPIAMLATTALAVRCFVQDVQTEYSNIVNDKSHPINKFFMVRELTNELNSLIKA